MLNNQKIHLYSEAAKLRFSFLFELEMKAYFSAGTNPEELILVNCTHSLSQVKSSYNLASKSYDLDLETECNGVENMSLSASFASRLVNIFPGIISTEFNKYTGNELIDSECMEPLAFAFLYMKITQLSLRDMSFQFIKFPKECIGGEGLFYIN